MLNGSNSQLIPTKAPGLAEGWGSRFVPVSGMDYGTPELRVSAPLSFHLETPPLPPSQVKQPYETAISKQNLVRTETSAIHG